MFPVSLMDARVPRVVLAPQAHLFLGSLFPTKVYFCDPHVLGSAAPTKTRNQLLRQYFPKGCPAMLNRNWTK